MSILLLCASCCSGGLTILFLDCAFRDPTKSQFLFYRFLDWASRTVLSIVGRSVWDSVSNALYFLMNKRHPLFQIFYLLIMSFSYMTLVDSCFPHIPNRFFSARHHLISSLVIALSVASFALVSLVNPGRITKDNLKSSIDEYEYDGLMFRPGIECPSCKIEKPARSKHCSACGICIARMDHHCIWVNNCIGKGNYHFFILFLCTHVFTLTYGLLLLLSVLAEIIISKKLLTARFVDSKGNQLQSSYWIIIQYLLNKHWGAIALLILDIVMLITLTVFLFLHLYLMIINQTTNESSKIDHLYQTVQQIEKQETKCALEKGKKDSERKKPILTKRLVDQSARFYNKGIWLNLRQIFP